MNKHQTEEEKQAWRAAQKAPHMVRVYTPTQPLRLRKALSKEKARRAEIATRKRN